MININYTLNKWPFGPFLPFYMSIMPFNGHVSESHSYKAINAQQNATNYTSTFE